MGKAGKPLFNAKVFEYVFVAGMGQAAFYLLAVVRLVGVFSVSAASGRPWCGRFFKCL